MAAQCCRLKANHLTGWVVMDQWPEAPAPLWSLTTIPLLLYFSGDILNALANVSGRKHPSTVQGKQLKMCLPMMPVVLHLVMSQVTHATPMLVPRAEPPPLRPDPSIHLSWTRFAHGFGDLIRRESRPTGISTSSCDRRVSLQLRNYSCE